MLPYTQEVRQEIRGYSFGPFELALDRYQLLKGNRAVPLEPRIFEVLSFLLAHRGRVVSKDELWSRLWGGRSVADSSLARAIQGVRQVLEDSPDEPRWIKTIYGRGYVFLGDAQEIRRAPVSSDVADLVSGLAAVAVPIAVLPFRDLSPDGDLRYFCDGLAEEILDELSRVEGLSVAARAASFRYRDGIASTEEMGGALGVRFLLEGSVRHQGNTLRITVQLLSVAEGRQLWSGKYDRDYDGDDDNGTTFAVQSKIARQVAQQLPLLLPGGPQESLGTLDLDAFDRYLRARRHQRLNTCRGFSEALGLYQEAAELDPQFGDAFAGIALCSASLFFFFKDTPEMLARAQAACEHALAVAPRQAWSHHARAIVHWMKGDLETASQAFESTLHLDPAHYDGFIDAGRFAVFRQNLPQAQGLFRHAARLRLDRFDAFLHLASCAEAQGRLDECRELCRKVTLLAHHHLEGSSEDSRAWCLGSLAQARLGQEDPQRAELARRWLERALEIDPDDARLRYNAACIHAILGEPPQALRHLLMAIRNGFPRWELAMLDPDLATLRSRPRFQSLLRFWQRRSQAGRRHRKQPTDSSRL